MLTKYAILLIVSVERAIGNIALLSSGESFSGVYLKASTFKISKRSLLREWKRSKWSTIEIGEELKTETASYHNACPTTNDFTLTWSLYDSEIESLQKLLDTNQMLSTGGNPPSVVKESTIATNAFFDDIKDESKPSHEQLEENIDTVDDTVETTGIKLVEQRPSFKAEISDSSMSVLDFTLGVLSAILFGMVAAHLLEWWSGRHKRWMGILLQKVDELSQFRRHNEIVQLLSRCIPEAFHRGQFFNSDIAALKHCLAKSYLALNNSVCAESVLREVLAEYETMGEDLHLAAVLEDLGCAVHAQHRLLEADNILRRALRILCEEELSAMACADECMESLPVPVTAPSSNDDGLHCVSVSLDNSLAATSAPQTPAQSLSVAFERETDLRIAINDLEALLLDDSVDREEVQPHQSLLSRELQRCPVNARTARLLSHIGSVQLAMSESVIAEQEITILETCIDHLRAACTMHEQLCQSGHLSRDTSNLEQRLHLVESKLETARERNIERKRSSPSSVANQL